MHWSADVGKNVDFSKKKKHLFATKKVPLEINLKLFISA